MITAGIDVGSTATKAVIFDGTIRSMVIIPTGWNPKEVGRNVFLESLNQAGLQEQDVDMIVGTGYGRVSLSFIDKKVTEITCHAKGAKFLFPQTRTVIDIGGQDSKVIAVAEDGSVADFMMNDKCAAGTGRFLQVMTGILDITLDELGQMESTTTTVEIGSITAIKRIILTFQQVKTSPIVVITGCETGEIEHDLADYGVIFLQNKQFENSQICIFDYA